MTTIEAGTGIEVEIELERRAVAVMTHVPGLGLARRTAARRFNKRSRPP